MSATLALRLATEATRQKYRNDPEFDDIVQEVALHTLKIIGERPNRAESYYWGVAKMALRRVISHDRRWTGMAKRSSFYKDPLRTGVAPIGEDAANGKDPATAYIEPGIQAVEWGMLRGRIEVVINNLSGSKTREIVRRMYHESLTANEAGLRIGSKAGRALWSAVRTQLATELSDLKELVA